MTKLNEGAQQGCQGNVTSQSPVMKSRQTIKLRAENANESPMCSPKHFNLGLKSALSTPVNNIRQPPTLKKIETMEFKKAGNQKPSFGEIMGSGGYKGKSKTTYLSGLNLFLNRQKRFYIAEQLELLKKDSRVNSYIRQKITEALDDVNQLNKILKYDGTMHDFLKYIGKGNFNQPCKDKYTPLTNLRLGDFSIEELDIDTKELQNALLKRFETHEKAYLSLKGSVRKREALPVKQTPKVRSLEFRSNDVFFSSRRQVNDFKPIEKELSSIFELHNADQSAAQRRALQAWRLKKEKAEENSAPVSSGQSTTHGKSSSFMIRKPKNRSRHLQSIS